MIRVTAPAAAAVFLLSACSGLHLDEGSSVPAAQTTPVATVQDCEEPPARVDDESTREEILLGLACGVPSHVSFEAATSLPDVWDDAVAAAVVVRCAESERCDAERAASLGLIAFLGGRMTDPEDIDGVAALRDGERTALAERLDAAMRVVEQRTDQIDEVRQALYVDLPTLVAGDLDVLRTTFAAHAEEAGAYLDAVAAEIGEGVVGAERMEQGTAIRAAYVADCQEISGLSLEECLAGPVARPITWTLAELALANGDHPRVLAEIALAQPMDRSTFMPALLARGAELRRIAVENYEAAQTALADGASEAEVADIYGPVVDLRNDAVIPWEAAEPPVRASEAMDGVAHIVGMVEDVDDEGEYVVVEFDRLTISPGDFACEESDIARVDWAAQTLFTADCESFDERRRLRPDDVELDGAAASLRSGQIVEAWIDVETRRGVLTRAFADEDSRSPSQLGLFEPLAW